MKTLFERSVAGRCCTVLPACDTEYKAPKAQREKKLHLPELSETDISRHYTELAKQTFGVNDGFYPLGSCTMKYNPKINERLSRLDGFVNVHPLQPVETVQGSLLLMYELQGMLQRVSGMDACTLTPAAGYHEEYKPRCTCACHSFIGGLWITALNVMHYLFKVKYVCCYDMYATHGDKLAYAA